MNRDIYMYCKKCDICQRVGPKISKSSRPLHLIMPTEVFQRGGLMFIGPINPPVKGTKNNIVLPPQITLPNGEKQEHLRINTATSTAKFIFEEIITKFRCPIEFYDWSFLDLLVFGSIMLVLFFSFCCVGVLTLKNAFK